MEGCGKYLGYRHMSGTKAWCGDDVVTHIVYCEKCRKKLSKDSSSSANKEKGK